MEFAGGILPSLRVAGWDGGHRGEETHGSAVGFLFCLFCNQVLLSSTLR